MTYVNIPGRHAQGAFEELKEILLWLGLIRKRREDDEG